MATRFEAAVLALYQGPPEAFVSERKRLSGLLKAEGDKDAAQRLMKLQRPTVSVWLVNQLHARNRERFERLLVSAAAIRGGDRSAVAEHREALTLLRTSAIALLAEAGRPVQDAVVRRVVTTLSTLAANGGFEPDLPGALTSDREAVGFDVVMSFPERSAAAEASERVSEPEVDAAELDRARERQESAEAARALEAARVQRAAERARLEAELKAKEALVHERERELTRLRAQLERVEAELADARQAASDVAARIAASDESDS